MKNFRKKILNFFNIDLNVGLNVGLSNKRNEKRKRNESKINDSKNSNIENIIKEEIEKIKKSEKIHFPRECKSCKNKNFCNVKSCTINEFYCDFLSDIKFNKEKNTIIIIEDNIGIASFFENEMKDLFPDYNIITFYGNNCGFYASSFIENNKNLKLKYIITDIYFPSVQISPKNKLKLDGIDIVISFKNINKDKKIGIIFISNIQFNKKYKEKFKNTFNKDLDLFLLGKNNILDLKKVIFKKIQNEENML